MGTSPATAGTPDSTLTPFISVSPSGLTQGTVSDGQLVPTVTDNAYTQGLISAEVLGISFSPASSDSDVTGVLNLGGTDSSRYTGDINFVCVLRPTPSPLQNIG